MKYLFLPGNSARNKDWIDSLADEFDNEKVVIHYDHWEKKVAEIDFDKELEKLKDLPEKEYIVVAKSVGSILALKAVKKKVLNIKKCFLIGFPELFAKNHNIDTEKLLNTEQELSFIQKLHDYQIGYEELKEKTSKIARNSEFILYKQRKEPNDNHHYANTKYLKDIITKN